MFETLFGAELPLPVRFFLAFLIVLGTDRRDRVGGAPVRHRPARRRDARGRQPRLGVIDYASVDGRRRLILVRRDNVEHLLMIGGPTDVVVEANIVRAVAALRATSPWRVRRRGTAAARHSVAGERQRLVAAAAGAGDAAGPARDAEIRTAAGRTGGLAAAAGRRNAGASRNATRLPRLPTNSRTPRPRRRHAIARRCRRERRLAARTPRRAAFRTAHASATTGARA